MAQSLAQDCPEPNKSKTMTFNLANTLTLFRIVAIPLFAICFFLPFESARHAAALLFAAAAITDLLDGYVARKLDQITEFGAFLDPVADKLIVATALVLLTQADPRISLAMISAIIIGREITVSALREWMASMGELTTVAVTFVAKIKTTVQMFGLAFMIWGDELFGIDLYPVGFVLLIIAAGLTMWSMWVYLRAAWPSLSRDA